MIDFRYFLISVIAVFLAMGVGIVMGSGLIGGEVVEGLQGQARGLFDRNDELERQILELEDEEDHLQDVLASIEPMLVDNTLVGSQVVVVEVDGTDGELIDAIRQVVEEADGNVVSVVSFTDKFALADSEEIEELQEIAGAESANADVLRADVGGQIGALAGVAAGARSDDRGRLAPQGSQEMLESLRDADYVTIESDQDRAVPIGASFVIAGGSPSDIPFPAVDMIESMALALDELGRSVIVAETSDSTWELTADLRGDDELVAAVSTVDNAETVPGRISVALGLNNLASDPAFHAGTDGGATVPIPTPSP